MNTYYICVNENKDRKYKEHPSYKDAEKEAIRLYENTGDEIKVFKIESKVKSPPKLVIEKVDSIANDIHSIWEKEQASQRLFNQKGLRPADVPYIDENDKSLRGY